MLRFIFAIVLASSASLALADDPGVPPNRIAEAKLIEWGWGTPSAPVVRERIREMEKVPFDGLVLTVTQNGMHDLLQRPHRQHTFTSRCFGNERLPREWYSESIEALRSIRFERFTDNFLRFNVTPGDVDWFAENWHPAANAGLLAGVAKEAGLKGIFLDTEAYSGGNLFNYKRQLMTETRSLEEYQKQVRARGRELIQAINKEYPDITLVITLAYSMAHFPDDHAQKYQLLPAFLDGILEAANDKTVVYDGWEYAYSFRTEKEFADTRRIIREKALTWTAVPDAMKKNWRASFGVWLDYGSHFDPKDFSKNFFTPEEFAFTVHQGLRYTDRYVWIWSERATWWNDTLPQPYVDALREARKESVPAPAPRPQ